MNSMIEEDETFNAAEKYLDERMFWNLLAFLNINDDNEKQTILNSSLPDEVMDERFSFIQGGEEYKSQQHSKSPEVLPMESKPRSPKIRMKPSMKEIFDGSYYKKQKEHAMRSNPSLFMSRSGANSLSMSTINIVEEKTPTIEEEMENIIAEEVEKLIRTENRRSLSRGSCREGSSSTSPEQSESSHHEEEAVLYATENPYRVLKVKKDLRKIPETKKKVASREAIGNIKSVLLNQFELTTMLSNQLSELRKKKQ
ncbi:hypothetical protein C9374_008751 [Naegleria lovaniensis]|uniref:Uncharacterized protein n=1 Tax=Naegleria lovaniensis TaxID=51637 RepID=A0AA88GEX5_NAELO|nr:uncharacterized protein C9374_008751 [Naegleria lovaniensis]KAG2378129.1 hypothetical protein C9374_008751 [Naegleria lovaniensis]